MRHRREIAERIRIRELAVFLETSEQIAALHAVEAARVAAVVPGATSALTIEPDVERIAAALRVDFKSPRLWMIPPDALSHDVRDRCAIEPRPGDVRGDGRALCGVEPAVRPPPQRIGRGVGVL